MQKYDIFISYRRDGAYNVARSIYDRLVLSGYSIFLDIESMKTGKFNEQIYSVIDNCKIVLLILPPHGLDRCVNRDDWVKREIAYSFEKGKTILPVMMAGFEWPDWLPDEINELRHCHGVQDTNIYYDAEIDKICTLMKAEKVYPVNLFRKLIGSIFFIIISLLFCLTALQYYISNHNARKKNDSN